MIRWITEALGTAAFTDPEIDATLAVVDVRDLVDKHGNPADAMREKIERGVALLREGRRLVVCCDYGISRSNAVAAGVLSRRDGVSLEVALRRVMKATGEQEIKLEPLRSVRAALATEAETRDASAPRVLITGGAGFVGGRLRAALGESVFHCAPSRSEADLVAGALELDLLVKEHRINCIVHLANPRVYTSNKALGETVTMLRNTLEVCRDNDLRLVYPSSWEVYSGYRGIGILTNEAVPLFPKGPYGETKALCEYMIELHRAHHGLRCALLRSSPLYGAGSDRPKFIYNFLEKALRGQAVQSHRYLNGDPCLDLMSVDDFVAALSLAVHADFVGTLNLGSGETVSTREVAEWIVRQCGSTSRVESRQIEEHAPNIAMDYRRAKHVLGWYPRTTWQAGLAHLMRNMTAIPPRGPHP